MGARFPVVFFDLDGTLLRGTSVSALLAEWLGKAGVLDELERRYRDGHISNSVVADTSAAWFAGRHVDDVAVALESGTWLQGVTETVRELQRVGSVPVLATVTWRFAAEAIAGRYGFVAFCGTEMEARAGKLRGTVSRYFDAEDKAAFVEEVCDGLGVAPSAAAAVGDSRSDLPTFARVGFSIALNADASARAAATAALDTDDLLDVLPLLGVARGVSPRGCSA